MLGEAKIYEQRVVAFIDIIGWSEACKKESVRLTNAIKAIRDTADNFSEVTKNKVKALPQTTPNPMYLQVQVGALSDCITISMPAEFGHRILSAAANISRKLLQLGFLTRGGITVGDLYHQDNMVFGPALVEAVHLEKEAIYPRLVCSAGLLEYLSDFPPEFHENNYSVIEDHLGRKVANLFEIGYTAKGKSMMNEARELWGLTDIEMKIESEIQKHIADKSDKYLEKWRYMKEVMHIMLGFIKDHQDN